MEYLVQLITLSGIVLLACASPGPDFVAVTSHALHSRRSGVFVGLGIACAVTVWAILAILGFGLLIKEMFWLYEIIRIAGAVYLSYLGIRMLMAALRKAPADAKIARTPVAGVGHSWKRGLLVGMTNPKTATFFATLFVTMLPVGAPAWFYITVVSLVSAITALWLGLLATFFSVGCVRAGYLRIRRPIDALMGAALVGLGVRLATTR